MMKFLTIGQIVKIHSILIFKFGGAKGIRSINLLESAVHRMQASFDGHDLYESVFEKAAALFESILKNHPFMDGNKRSAFLCTTIFLEINGCKTKFDDIETEKFILEVIDNVKTFKDIAVYLRNNTQYP